MATGFLGSVHCLGMCGGISGTVALAATPSPVRPRNAAAMICPSQAMPPARPAVVASVNVLAFNAGRICSYALAGAIAGGAGSAMGQAWLVGELYPGRFALFLFANLMIVLSGLYVMGWPQLLAPMERAGGNLWRRLSPMTKKLLPIDTPAQAATFGMLWGWIPCGLVYAMLLSATSAGSVSAGALVMFAFGLGTLPAMMSAGLLAGQLKRWTRDSRVRSAAGAGIVAMGMFGFWRAGSLESLQAFGAFCLQVAR